MIVSKFNFEAHSQSIQKWGLKYGFPLPAQEILPETGFIVEDLACGFLYKTNSKLAWLEWVFSNPEKPKEDRAKALDLIFKTIEQEAKSQGFLVLFSAAAISGYAQVLQRNGFQETDKNVSHHIKLIGG